MMRCRNCFVRSSRGSLKIWSRRALLQDDPFVQETHAARDVLREPHLVGRDQHRHPPGRQLADHVEHLGDELRVERARDLVQQHDVGLHRQRANDRDALLLPARQPIGILVRLVGQPEPVEQLPRALLSLVRGESEHLPRRQRDVPQHGHVREQVERLEDDADLAPDRVRVDARRRDVDDRAPRSDPASSGSSRLMHRSSVDLPGTGGADQTDDLVLGDRRGRPRAGPRARRTACARRRS